MSNDAEILALAELDSGFTHAENLHLFIDDVLKKAGVQTGELEAVAVSRGPGSYTGLRIGASTAKGLAYALKIPLIAVDTLMIMSEMARQQNGEASFYCPMLDARRMEVYTAVHDVNLGTVMPVEALIVNAETAGKLNMDNICFFGDGMDKCRELLSGMKNVSFIENIKPSAKYMGALAAKRHKSKQFEDVAYFEPFYLKDFLIVKKGTET